MDISTFPVAIVEVLGTRHDSITKNSLHSTCESITSLWLHSIDLTTIKKMVQWIFAAKNTVPNSFSCHIVVIKK